MWTVRHWPGIESILGEGSGTPIAGMLKFVPLMKLNAVLVITPQLEYLKEAAIWIERLDGIGGERLYVYQVQNSRADYVAELLNGLLTWWRRWRKPRRIWRQV